MSKNQGVYTALKSAVIIACRNFVSATPWFDLRRAISLKRHLLSGAYTFFPSLDSPPMISDLLSGSFAFPSLLTAVANLESFHLNARYLREEFLVPFYFILISTIFQTA